MGFRFRRSVKILPGVKINLNKASMSLSVGGRGFHYTVGQKGTRITAGIPGTGLSWTDYRPNVSPSVEFPNLLQPTLSHPSLSQGHEPLEKIQNSSADQISALSTSELAPILNDVNRRVRLAPIIAVVCLVLFAASLMQSDKTWVNLVALYATVFVFVAILLDRYRRSVSVMLDPSSLSSRITESLSIAFKELMQCKAIWNVSAQARTADWKRNAGASTLVTRKQISLRFGKPACIRGRIKFPFFGTGSDELYLLPDAALVIVRKRVASVSYRELDFSCRTVEFREEGRPPSDAHITEYAWRYVNKSGGPDRRFNNNGQLPVCRYGELDFRSAGGLNCKVQISRSSAADSLYKVIEALKQTSVEIPKSVTYIKTAKRTPTIIFISIFVVLAAIQVALFQHDVVKALTSLNSHASVDTKQTISGPTILSNVQVAPKKDSNKNTVADSQQSPVDLNEGAAQLDFKSKPPTDIQNHDRLLSLSEPQNIAWVQSRLRELGFLHGLTKGWDISSRAALRDFKTTNNLSADDKWDLGAQELLASGPVFGAEQTFIGSWSEVTCALDAKPDISITSRRAVSSAGGVCEFSNVRYEPHGWSVDTACSNAGEKWKASIRLAVNGEMLLWTGRDGRQTQYHRCQ